MKKVIAVLLIVAMLLLASIASAEGDIEKEKNLKAARKLEKALCSMVMDYYDRMVEGEQLNENELLALVTAYRAYYEAGSLVTIYEASDTLPDIVKNTLLLKGLIVGVMNDFQSQYTEGEMTAQELQLGLQLSIEKDIENFGMGE